MTRVRAVMLADGTSDEPLASHAAALARRAGVGVDIVVPDFARLDPPPGRTIDARLTRLLTFDRDFEMVLVHRDAEKKEPSERIAEIAQACQTAGLGWPTVPIVPIRMTEAWLLLDEHSIRLVAGKPTGRHDLFLPRLAQSAWSLCRTPRLSSEACSNPLAA